MSDSCTIRAARCVCGALSVSALGEPIKISACHCRSCQRRTGSAFSVAVFYPRESISVAGAAAIYTRQGDSGLPVAFHFCPQCASTVIWYPAFRPNYVGVAIGCFDDTSLVPTQAVYERNRLEWTSIALSNS